MSQSVVVDAPTAVENEMSPAEMPQAFAANLFAGPCFGDDFSPSESSAASLPDAPSPSPLLLNSLADSNPQVASIRPSPTPETEDFIDFTDAEENMLIPTIEPCSSQNEIYDTSTVKLLMDSNPIYNKEPPQAPDISSVVHLDDSSGFSSALNSVDEPTLVRQTPLDESLERSDSDTFPSNAEENVFPDLTLEEYSLNEITEPLAQTMHIDVTSDKNVLLPSSSSTSSPTFTFTLPAHPSSQTSSDVIDPYSFPTSPYSKVDDPPPTSTTLYEPETADFPTSSSPPTSSPELLFSSSPPAASDSSVLFEDFPKSANTYMSVVSTDLPPSSSPSQHPSSAQIHDLEPMNQDVLNAPPPSSSPMPSTSPLYPQSLELTEPLIKSEEACGVVSPRPNIEQEEDSSIGVSASHSSTALVGSSVDFPGQKNDEGPFSHKRKRDEEEAREIIPQPPNPKRPTLASQKLQRKTLVKPFRSPAIMTPKAPEPIPPPPVLKKESVSVELLTKDDLKKHRTQRAAGQFKSPLPAAVSSSIFSAVRPTPTIQALEHKVQVLRRAVKVKKGREEETLEALAKKWTEAGREVAWEVWSLIKDQENGSADEWGKESQNATSGKRKFEDSWGWNEDSSSKRVKTEWDADRNWGWETAPTTDNEDHPPEEPVESVEAEEKPRETLGTMLMRLGIAPSTLGWNDEQEEFVD